MEKPHRQYAGNTMFEWQRRFQTQLAGPCLFSKTLRDGSEFSEQTRTFCATTLVMEASKGGSSCYTEKCRPTRDAAASASWRRL